MSVSTIPSRILKGDLSRCMGGKNKVEYPLGVLMDHGLINLGAFILFSAKGCFSN